MNCAATQQQVVSSNSNQPAANGSNVVFPSTTVKKEPEIPSNDSLRTFFTVIFGGITAGLLATWIGNLLTVRREERRDKAQRRREFRGYLAELESRIERLPDDIRGNLGDNKIWNGYLEVIHHFHQERGKVMCDFLPHDEFNRLCDAFGRLGYKAVAEDPQKRHPRNVLAEAVKALVQFTGERLA